ncbi:MAG: hypothetical protein L6R35_007344, partial [Caloplaca aegaea]
MRTPVIFDISKFTTDPEDVARCTSLYIKDPLISCKRLLFGPEGVSEWTEKVKEYSDTLDLRSKQEKDQTGKKPLAICTFSCPPKNDIEGTYYRIDNFAWFFPLLSEEQLERATDVFWDLSRTAKASKVTLGSRSRGLFDSAMKSGFKYLDRPPSTFETVISYYPSPPHRYIAHTDNQILGYNFE